MHLIAINCLECQLLAWVNYSNLSVDCLTILPLRCFVLPFCEPFATKVLACIFSLIPHLGGYQGISRTSVCLNFCLMRVRPDISVTSGCLTLAYLPTSQNKF